MASYVLQTSVHFLIILFSHRPLKFFFLIPAKPPIREHPAILPKTFPKMKSDRFWGICLSFLGNGNPLKVPVYKDFKPILILPKTS